MHDVDLWPNVSSCYSGVFGWGEECDSVEQVFGFGQWWYGW